MVDVKKLLKKKHLNGRELGIIEITNTAILFEQGRDGKQEAPLMEVSKIRELANAFTEKEDKRLYDGYMLIHEWLIFNLNLARTEEQKALYNCFALTTYTSQATLTENLYSFLESLPELDAETTAKKESLYNINFEFSLQSFLPEAKDYYENNIACLLETKADLLNRYYFIKGYNLALDLIAKHFDLQALEVFKVDLHRIERNIEDINQQQEALLEYVKNNPCKKNSLLNSKKKKVIKRCFGKIVYSNLEQPIEKIEEVQKLFENFVAFKDYIAIAELLFYLTDANTGEGAKND